MVLDNRSTRACIYFIYDGQGVVDDYIIYQLKDMRKNVEFLHCVINGELNESGRNALEEIADEVFVRVNQGNDIGAYKAAIEHIGWDKLSQYDELVLMNFTCFGPVYPFCEVFNWANKQDVEVWGLTWDRKTDWLGTDEYLHANKKKLFIQSYFLAVRKPLLGSKLLADFYREIPDDTDYVRSGAYYEYAFPGYFEEYGYKSAVYCDEQEDFNYPLLLNPVHLMEKWRMPLFKKRGFAHHYTDLMNNTAGEGTARLIHFIEEKTDYDMGLVWQSILRLNSLSDIVRCAQLNRVLPARVKNNDDKTKSRIGLVFFAGNEKPIEDDLLYIKNFPQSADFLIFTVSAEMCHHWAEMIEREGLNGIVYLAKDALRPMASLLVEANEFVQDHDLICFAQDRAQRNDFLASAERSCDYRTKENMFGSAEYVGNIIDTFEKEPMLGIAFPSPPNHGIYADAIGNGWCGYYVAARDLLDSFHVNAKTNLQTLCVAPIDGCFWFRPAALKQLFAGWEGLGWKYADCAQIEENAIVRTLAYFAQAAGFYPCYLYNSSFAEIELTNLEFNKAGSLEMKAWVEVLAMDSIGYKTVQDVFGKPYENVSRQELLDYYYPQFERKYTVKQSLVLLSQALGRRYANSKFWHILSPLRKVVKKALKIK